MTWKEGALSQAAKNGRTKVGKKNFFFFKQSILLGKMCNNAELVPISDNICGHSRQTDSRKQRNKVNMDGLGVSNKTIQG